MKVLMQVLLLVILGFSFLTLDVKACTCAPRSSTYKEFQQAAAVFVGKVVRSKDVASTEVIRDKEFRVFERTLYFSGQ